jgi:2-phosphosulfolactate phosphatase
MTRMFTQESFPVRLEWGVAGVKHLAPHVDCVVIIDVMSFSTCVNIAVEHGALVYPYPWRDDSASDYGRQVGALVASSKRRFDASYSLSPTSLLGVPAGLRLVLPSPNGSAAAYYAGATKATVLCGCLRNAAATARACRDFSSVLVVPCGERWPDAGLRPSFEDYMGAGAVLAALGGRASPEAHAAALSYEHMGANRAEALRACGSALELVERGFGEDVELCFEENSSEIVCVLQDGYFTAPGTTGS